MVSDDEVSRVSQSVLIYRKRSDGGAGERGQAVFSAFRNIRVITCGLRIYRKSHKNMKS